MELAFFTVKVLLDQRAMLICESMMIYDTCSQSLRPRLPFTRSRCRWC